jgi:hypothetical protein
MTKTQDAPDERDEIEMLLPWYATGRLDEADRAKVATWLARDEALARQLAIIEEEQDATRLAAEAMPAPARMSVERVVARIPERRANPAGLHAAVTGWLDRALASLSPAGLRWAATAALLLVVVQAAGIGLLMRGGGSERGYETASGQAGRVATGLFVIVRIDDSVSVATLGSALAEIGATIEHGPTADGLYRLRIGPADLDEAVRKDKLDRLRARSEVFPLVLPEPARRSQP